MFFAKIKSKIAELFLVNTLPLLRYISNRQIIFLTYIAEKILIKQDPIVNKAIKQIREYFREDHPSIELVRRILKDLSPQCKRKLLKNFFVNAIFKGVTKSKEYAQRYGFNPPWFLVLSPTMRCNLNCVGCSTRRYTKDDDLSISLIDRILNEAKEMGIYFIVTQGGEMFVYEEMLEVYKKHSDVYFQVYTNGTLIDKKMASTLAKLGNVAPMISLEGFQETTDRRRGKGVFKKVMQAMDNLREEGCFFGASVTQTRNNTEEILSDEFFNLLYKKGCFVIWFFQFLPIGKDPDLDLMATPQQRHQLYLKIQDIRARLPIFIGDFWNDGPFVGGCIAAGRRYVHINNKGDVEPCAFVHFALDNIKEKSLREALNSVFFKFLRQLQPFNQGNLLVPCMIIDQPEVLRQAVKESGAHPTHEGAELILDGKISLGLDEYAREIQRITLPIWEKIKDKAVKWPT
ncbi:MAG: radical SAM protein [Candidatus Omnitrophica bacterium]|nr:radical SAM protein [Candidatus Omnitrophota bacterium]